MNDPVYDECQKCGELDDLLECPTCEALCCERCFPCGYDDSICNDCANPID